MFDGFFENLFGDPGFREPTRLELGNDAVSDLLPYRVFDPEQRLYHNHKTSGFIFEITPVIDADETASALHGALVAACPSEAGVQFISWASPDVEKRLGAWARAKSHGGDVMERIARRRVDHIMNLRFGSQHSIKSIPNDRRVFVSAWIEGDTGMAALAKLIELRGAMTAALGLKNDASLRPGELLALLRDIFQAESFGVGEPEYSEGLPINAQLPGITCQVASTHLGFGEEAQTAATALSVAKFPGEWNARLCEILSGDPDRITDRPHGPVLTALTAFSVPQAKASADFIVKRGRMEHAQASGISRFTPNFEQRKDEFATLAETLENGERLFKCVMSVVAYVNGDRSQVRSAGAEIAKIYRRAGIALRDEKYLQLPMFLMALPLVPTSEMINSLARMQRMRLLKAEAMTSLAPMVGEWKGNSVDTGVLLLGRQGQVLCWDNFISEGNYNVSVVGKSGAGKSVFMQELVVAIFSNGGRVLVIVDGYSFKNTCDVLGGSHIAFDGEREIRLNPFSMLDPEKMESDEYVADAVELITRVIGSMAALGEQREGRVVGMEEQSISKAVLAVWKEKGAKGEITDVRALLVDWCASDARLKDVVDRLEPFSSGGVYGAYFEGAATLKIDSAFTVVEMSDIKSQKALEAAILQLVMFLGTELMFKTDRSVPVAIVIDEAWDMLRGEGNAAFIEGVVRRARKYTGALITGTQSIDDYYALPAAEVCLQNSDWTVFLAQKGETIDRLEASQKLSVAPGFGARLKTVTSVPGQFSEMAIKGEGGWAFGRLLLDPFSLTAYSSKGATVARLDELRHQGLTTVQALDAIIAEGGEV